MSRLLLLWACNTAALFAADWLIDGVSFDDERGVVIAGAVFGLVNWLLKPVATLLALPLIILTLGLALFLVNMLMLYVTSWVAPGFDLDGFWPAVGATIVIWAVNSVLQSAFGVDDRRSR